MAAQPRDLLEKPHGQPSDSRENNSSAATPQSDIPNLNKVATALINKESTLAETNLPVSSYIHLEASPFKVDPLGQAPQPSPITHSLSLPPLQVSPATCKLLPPLSGLIRLVLVPPNTRAPALATAENHCRGNPISGPCDPSPPTNYQSSSPSHGA